MIVEVNHRTLCWRLGAFGRYRGRLQLVGPSQVEFPHQASRLTLAVRASARDTREQPPRTNHRLQQSSCRNTIAELKTVHNHPFHAEILSQGAHDMIEALTHQNDIRSRRLEPF